MKITQIVLLLLFSGLAAAFADTQVSQLSLALTSVPIFNQPNDGSAHQVIFRDGDQRVVLTLTVAAMPSSARQILTGLRLPGDWANEVDWRLTTDEGRPVSDQPFLIEELKAPRNRGNLGVGEQVSARYRLPSLPVGTYRLSARVAGVQSESHRFVVSDGTESLPLQTTYAWIHSREGDPSSREKWLLRLGDLDPTMPAPWIDLGDDALAREDFAAARGFYSRAITSYSARRQRFEQQGPPDLVRQIDAGRNLVAAVVAAIDSMPSTDNRLVVRLLRGGDRVHPERSKRYVVAERGSGRVVKTIE